MINLDEIDAAAAETEARTTTDHETGATVEAKELRIVADGAEIPPAFEMKSYAALLAEFAVELEDHAAVKSQIDEFMAKQGVGGQAAEGWAPKWELDRWGGAALSVTADSRMIAFKAGEHGYVVGTVWKRTGNFVMDASGAVPAGGLDKIPVPAEWLDEGYCGLFQPDAFGDSLESVLAHGADVGLQMRLHILEAARYEADRVDFEAEGPDHDGDVVIDPAQPEYDQVTITTGVTHDAVGGDQAYVGVEHAHTTVHADGSSETRVDGEYVTIAEPGQVRPDRVGALPPLGEEIDIGQARRRPSAGAAGPGTAADYIAMASARPAAGGASAPAGAAMGASAYGAGSTIGGLIGSVIGTPLRLATGLATGLAANLTANAARRRDTAAAGMVVDAERAIADAELAVLAVHKAAAAVKENPDFLTFLDLLKARARPRGESVQDIIHEMKPKGRFADLRESWDELQGKNAGLKSALDGLFSAFRDHETKWSEAADAVLAAGGDHKNLWGRVTHATAEISKGTTMIPAEEGRSMADMASKALERLMEGFRRMFRLAPKPGSAASAGAAP